MAHCDPPVPSIATNGDAFGAATINATRLNACIIKHEGLMDFELTTNPIGPTP